MYPRRPISLLLIFITVPHARLRKLGQVELSKRHTHVRQIVLPRLHLQRPTSVSGSGVSLLYL